MEKKKDIGTDRGPKPVPERDPQDRESPEKDPPSKRRGPIEEPGDDPTPIEAPTDSDIEKQGEIRL